MTIMHATEYMYVLYTHPYCWVSCLRTVCFFNFNVFTIAFDVYGLLVVLPCSCSLFSMVFNAKLEFHDVFIVRY